VATLAVPVLVAVLAPVLVLSLSIGALPAGATPSPTDTASGATTSTTSTSPLHVVGGPVAAEGAADVITVDAARNLHLQGIAPDTGKVLWSHPYDESAIIPGVAPTLYVVDNVVVDLMPADAPNDALVDVDGINATTGAIAWRGPQHLLVADAPAPCADKQFLCVIGYTSNTSTAMAVINPADGTDVAILNGPIAALDLDLYLVDAQTPTVEELSASGTVAWTKTIGQLFGGPGYDPGRGWDFLPFGSTEVGTAGAVNADHSMGLDDARTVGFALATGTATWSLAGQFQCGGSLGFETPPFDCVFKGDLAKPNQDTFPISYTGLHLSLQGFDASTGAVTWTLPVRNVDALVNGDAAFLDDTHLVVQLDGGATVLLDTSNGTTSALGRHQVLWCSSSGLFKVNEDKDLNSAEQRVTGTRFYPCVDGKATAALPASSPSSIGVTVDGVFLWPSPQGLSRRTVGSASGVA